MSRIAPLEAPYAEKVQAQFEAIMGDRPPLALFRTVATSERAWRKFRGGSLLDGEVLSLREREIIINRTCARAGSEYEWGVHVTLFRKAAGLSDEEIAATLRVPTDLRCWAPNEAALILAVDALHERANLTEPEFRALRCHYAEDQVLEILLLAGFYRTVAYLTNGLAIPLEPAGARFADYAA